jgi:hypothetical protein
LVWKKLRVKSEEWRVESKKSLWFGVWGLKEESGNPFFVILNELLGEEESLRGIRG